MTATAHLVCFRVGRETYGVDIFVVREIVKAQEITQVPGASEYLLGIINLRGKIISVVDLAQRLGLGKSKVDRASRILVVDLDGFTVGFLVDAATEVLKLAPESIEAAPEELKRSVHDDYLEGVGKLKDRLVIILNPGNLLADGEASSLATGESSRAKALR
ncbi:MAG TPA: chemotaxis protein CheW [Vicinamibacteria bacterium]|nr:chemotaxis protein CheW [Vicinamibacteria bacterium]